MPLKPVNPESTAEVKVVEKLERLQEPNVTAAKDMPALAESIEEQYKADDGEVKVLWDKRKTPEELEEEAYRKKQAARINPQPIALDKGLAEPIHTVSEPLDSVSEAPEPEPEAPKVEPEAPLPATEPTEPSGLEQRVAELESTSSEFDTDLARLERLMATLSKYHPELFKKPVVVPTVQEVAEKLIKLAKKEVPYVPLDPSVDGRYLEGYDAASKGLQRTRRPQPLGNALRNAMGKKGR